MQVVLLIFSLAATVLLPLLFFRNLKRLKPWLGFCLLLGGAAFLITSFFLADAVVPGLMDAIFGSIQFLVLAFGLGWLWYFGFRNMLRLLGMGFWLWLGAAIVMGGMLGLLSSGSSPLDQLVAQSQIFGDYLQGVLGSSPDGGIDSVVRVATFLFLFTGLIAGVGLGLGGKSAGSGKHRG